MVTEEDRRGAAPSSASGPAKKLPFPLRDRAQTALLGRGRRLGDSGALLATVAADVGDEAVRDGEGRKLLAVA
jgi:hypothetical protein